MPSKTSPTDKVASKSRPPHSSFDNIVTVEVGPKKTKFGIHKGLLMHYSAYFRGVFGGNFQEAKQGLVHLADEDPKIFKKVYEWLYTRNLADTLEGEMKLNFAVLLDLYLFGEKRMVPTLQNDTIDVIIRKCTEENYSPVSMIETVYEELSASSPLRKLIVDIAIHRDTAESFASKKKFYTEEFVVEVATEMLRIRTLSHKTWDYFLPYSKYHVPEEVGGTSGQPYPKVHTKTERAP